MAALLVEFGAILFALGLLGRFARALRIPVVPLYLLAGLFFGNGGAVHLTASHEFLDISAEIGVILLLVMLGLEYSAGELVSSLRTQAPMGLLDGVVNALPGAPSRSPPAGAGSPRSRSPASPGCRPPA